jgi:hypothetical protein
VSVSFVAAKKEPAYRVPAKAVSADYLAGPGSLRVQHLMYLFGCSHSTVFKRIARGDIPKPSGNDPNPPKLSASAAPKLNKLKKHLT